MKALFSAIVELTPLVLVFLWLSISEKLGKRSILKALGGAFIASGACSFVGVRYFGLAVFGRYSVMKGETGEGACLFMAVVGLGLLLLHFGVQAIKRDR